VPQRLLEQFAYFDPKTQSLRLWRYEAGRKPYWRASPETATAEEYHFSDPMDENRERVIEKRLASEVEDPVNKILNPLCSEGYEFRTEDKQNLTRYLQVMFHRSIVRRRFSAVLATDLESAFERFLANEQYVLTVLALWNIEAALSSKSSRFYRKSDLERIFRRNLAKLRTDEAVQQRYVETVERSIESVDPVICRGDWDVIRTNGSDPFIISDTAFVSFRRDEKMQVHCGIGVHEQDAEIILPLSPLCCLHVRPKVTRTRQIVEPNARDINLSQIRAANRYCYADRKSSLIDGLMQQFHKTPVYGRDMYSVVHRDYAHQIFEMFMNTPRSAL
jgi:hypothetical protein